MAILASDGSSTDVQAKLNAASPGDTVTLPAGTFLWTTAVSRTISSVKLVGAGTTATGGGDLTVVQDNVASGSPMLQLATTSSLQISGITFRSGTGSLKDGGTIQLGGPSNVRIDHCHFVPSSGNNYKMIWFGAGVFGVMDRCIANLTSTNTFFFYNGRDNGTGGGQGNYEWTLPTDFGTDKYFYIEDCIISGNTSGGTYDSRVFDGFTAARVVVRFNDVHQAVLCEHHATGHSGDDRGPRSTEVYCNRVTSSLAKDPNFTAFDFSNGTVLAWGNSYHNVYKNLITLKLVRQNNGTYTQQATPNGWGYAGTAFNGVGSNWDKGTFDGSDTLRGYPAIDQVGRGAGDLLTGTFPSKVNSTTGTIKHPNQAHEPAYFWNNTGSIVPGWGGAAVSNQAGNARVMENRDFYLQAGGVQVSPTSPFNGTVGCGWGPIAFRPTTCTPGVGYFATDEGDWNKTESNPYGVQMNGASGKLYKCTAPNVWTEYYTPYTYPHPLREIPEPEPEPDPEEPPPDPGQHPPPVITPPAGSYTVPQNVTISIV